jgi:hypothetical protein
MTENTATPQAPQGDAALSADDLSLIDPNLEDQGRDEAEIWDEFDQAEAKPGSDADAAAAQSAEAGSAQAEGSEAGKEGAAKHEAGVAPPKEGAGTELPAQSQPDIWASAPPELKSAFEAMQAEKAKLEQRIRSDDGRVAAYQRKLRELQQGARGPDRDAGRAAVDARAAIEELAEQYPEIAQPLQKALDAVDSKLQTLDEREKSRTQAEIDEIEAHVAAETAKLEGEHPDWYDVLAKNGKAFAEWIEDQPRRIREAARRNDEQIISASQAAEVVEAFKKHLGHARQDDPQPKPTPAPAADPAATPAQPTPTPNPELNDRRRRQLAGSSSPPKSSGRPTVAGIPEDGDPEAIWAAFDAMERART